MTYVNHVFAHIAFLSIRTAASWFLPYSDFIDVASSADYVDFLLGGGIGTSSSPTDNIHSIAIGKLMTKINKCI
jgi:hypothetical protein